MKKSALFAILLVSSGVVFSTCEELFGGPFGFPIAPTDGRQGFDSLEEGIRAAGSVVPPGVDERNVSVDLRVFVQACVLGICAANAYPARKPCGQTFEEAAAGQGGYAGGGGGDGGNGGNGSSGTGGGGFGGSGGMWVCYSDGGAGVTCRFVYV